MAQRMLDLKKFKEIGIQTSNSKDMTINLTDHKKIVVYYSKKFRQYVVSFNLGKKKFILPKKSWTFFRQFIEQIDHTILNQ